MSHNATFRVEAGPALLGRIDVATGIYTDTAGQRYLLQETQLA